MLVLGAGIEVSEVLEHVGFDGVQVAHHGGVLGVLRAQGVEQVPNGEPGRVAVEVPPSFEGVALEPPDVRHCVFDEALQTLAVGPNLRLLRIRQQLESLGGHGGARRDGGRADDPAGRRLDDEP